MRSHQNPSLSTNRNAGNKLEMQRMPMPEMPMEWLDAGTWRLPSGKALAEFALQAGFLAPLLFRVERFGKNAGHAPVADAPLSDKNFGKGGNQ